VVCTVAQQAFAWEASLETLPAPMGSELVSGLPTKGRFTLPLDEIVDDDGELFGLMLSMSARISGVDGNLFVDSRKVELVREGTGSRFQALIPVTASKQEIKFTHILPNGQVRQSRFILHTAEFTEFQNRLQARRLASGQLLRPYIALQFSSVDYTETLFPDVSLKALTGKISFRARPKGWNTDFELGGFATLLPWGLNDPSLPPLRFLGLNFRVGRTVLKPMGGWSIRLYGGGYYTTTLVNGNLFGFKDVAGPQLYPVFIRAFGGARSVAMYAKYSPILIGIRPSFSSREFAAGASFSFPVSYARNLILVLDYADLSLNFTAPDAAVRSRSLSLGLGFEI